MSTCGVIYLRPFGGRVLGLGDHVDLEAGRAQLGGDLRDRVPDRFLVGADIDALGLTELPLDGRPSGR